MNPFINFNKKNKTNRLSGCSDCSITDPSNNEILQYSSTLGKWYNSAISAFSIALSQLIDVVIHIPQHNQVLSYDSASEKWKNVTFVQTIANCNDSLITTALNEQVLQYDTGKWRNKTLSLFLDSLGDTHLVNRQNGQVLKYETSSSKWKNSSFSINELANVSISNPSLNHSLVFNGSSWVNQHKSIMSHTTIKFIRMVSTIAIGEPHHGYIIDCFGMDIAYEYNLNFTTGCGSFYLQLLNGLNSSVILHSTSGHYIYKGYNDAWRNNVNLGYEYLQNDTTYLLTYYEPYTNPWALPIFPFPSYTIQVISNNVIPFPNVDTCLFITHDNHNCIGQVALPSSPADGFNVNIKDIGGPMAITQVRFFGSGSDTIDNNSSKLIQVNDASAKFYYYGSGKWAIL